jgi:hypothetical protein
MQTAKRHTIALPLANPAPHITHRNQHGFPLWIGADQQDAPKFEGLEFDADQSDARNKPSRRRAGP